MSLTRTYSGDAPVRLNKWLAQEGICSRREAEALIAQGQIAIDGAEVTEPGRKIAPGETLTVRSGGKAALDNKLTLVLHKPEGYVSGTPEADQVPAIRLVTRETLSGRSPVIPGPRTQLAPLGRLDQDSRGLLLLSDDGVLARAVIGPQSQLEKEYRVRVTGRVTPAQLERLRHGLVLDEKPLKRATVEEVSPGLLKFVLTEGRNRQIRRMCQLVDLKVLDLIRIRIGPVSLGSLAEGRWRPLGGRERSLLIDAARGQASAHPPRRSSGSRPSKPPGETGAKSAGKGRSVPRDGNRGGPRPPSGPSGRARRNRPAGGGSRGDR